MEDYDGIPGKVNYWCKETNRWKYRKRSKMEHLLVRVTGRHEHVALVWKDKTLVWGGDGYAP